MSNSADLNEAVRARRTNRRHFLELLYRSSEEDVELYRDAYQLAAELGLPRLDAERIARYLEDHGFVKKTGGTGLVLRITARGIDFLETGAARDHSTPSEPDGL